MQPWALVTPASRGIGLELVRRLLQTTNIPLLATARKDIDQAKEQMLQGLSNVQEDRLNVVKLDVLDEQTIADAAQRASQLFQPKESYLHLSLCIPGILFPEKSPSQIDHDNALLTLRTNLLGPMLVMKHFSSFLPRKSTKLSTEETNLPKLATWATMSARVGSVSDNSLGGWYSYRASKAGVTQLARTLDNHLRHQAGENAISIALHPGTVKTNLSREFWSTVKEDKLFSAEFAAEKVMEVVNGRTVDDRGRFWDWKGDEIMP